MRSCSCQSSRIPQLGTFGAVASGGTHLCPGPAQRVRAARLITLAAQSLFAASSSRVRTEPARTGRARRNLAANRRTMERCERGAHDQCTVRSARRHDQSTSDVSHEALEPRLPGGFDHPVPETSPLVGLRPPLQTPSTQQTELSERLSDRQPATATRALPWWTDRHTPASEVSEE